MAAGSTVYGKGHHDGIAVGRALERAEIVVQQRSAVAAHEAQQHANRVNVAAGAIGSVIAQMVPVVVSVAKERREAKKSDESA